MSYFSRLTDIVTCNLSEILAREADPAAALNQIVDEMQEGLDGAKRSMQTASNNVERLEQELVELRNQSAGWVARARQQLEDGNETQARTSLTRKKELEDLIAGMEQQLTSAIATREQLSTTYRALEARLLDARRRMLDLENSEKPVESQADAAPESAGFRAQQVEDELQALKRQLGQN